MNRRDFIFSKVVASHRSVKEMCSESDRELSHGSSVVYAVLNQDDIARAESQGQTLVLGPGVYRIDVPIELPASMSLLMHDAAVIVASDNFIGDCLIRKVPGPYRSIDGTSGKISGGVLDGGGKVVVGIKVGKLHRLVISNISIVNCRLCGVEFEHGGNECYMSLVRCDVSQEFSAAKGSIGVINKKTDCRFNQVTIIGYENGWSGSGGGNLMNQIHAWNWVPVHGEMKIGFICGGYSDRYSQCYADSFSEVGFDVLAGMQSFVQCKALYSRWSKDGGGVGFRVSGFGGNAVFLSNVCFGVNGHRLKESFAGDLNNVSIIGGRDAGIYTGIL